MQALCHFMVELPGKCAVACAILQDDGMAQFDFDSNSQLMQPRLHCATGKHGCLFAM
jgi:hypothetical protein